jgi:hypothetical protein
MSAREGERRQRPRSRRHTYSVSDVALLLKRYAGMAAAVEGPGRRGGALVEIQLVDIEDGLARLPAPLYDGSAPKHVSRRSNRALHWLASYLRGGESRSPIRELKWRSWATSDAERALESLDDRPAPGPGRPPAIPPAIDEVVLRLHATGWTEREIAQVLLQEHPRPDGRSWTRASVRSVLKR